MNIEHLPIEIDHLTHDDTYQNISTDQYNLLDDYPDIVGDPEGDAQYLDHQTTPFSCVPTLEKGIYETFTGEHLSEAHWCTVAAEHGFLSSENGTLLENVGKELEIYGIETHSVTEATIEDIFDELAHGHKVIVGVNAEKLLNTDHPFYDLNCEVANHAIWVTGIDKTNPIDIKIIINDSADRHGVAKEYPLQQFKDAWQDSNFFYVATDKAPPDLHEKIPEFDKNQGVFPDMLNWQHQYFS